MCGFARIRCPDCGEERTIDRIIRHPDPTYPELSFEAERPPPPQVVQQELLLAAEEREEYF